MPKNYTRYNLYAGCMSISMVVWNVQRATLLRVGMLFLDLHVTVWPF